MRDSRHRLLRSTGREVRAWDIRKSTADWWLFHVLVQPDLDFPVRVVK
jgi:hypothetical protein